MEHVRFDLGGEGSVGFRYALLERVRRLADRHGVIRYGFRIDRALTLLVDGRTDRITRLLHGIKTGTARAEGVPGLLGRTERLWYEPAALPSLLVQLHRAERPLHGLWSSHRELMGVRDAGFVDRSVWIGRVDPLLVHLRAGGGPLPVGVPLPLAPRALRAQRTHIDRCLRVAAATKGVLPGDRRAMRLYAHLGRATATPQVALADAVLLSPRRIRQLQRQSEPSLGAARRAMALTAP